MRIANGILEIALIFISFLVGIGMILTWNDAEMT